MWSRIRNSVAASSPTSSSGRPPPCSSCGTRDSSGLRGQRRQSAAAVPERAGRHLLHVMSANRFLTRMNLMQAIARPRDRCHSPTVSRCSSSAATRPWTRRTAPRWQVTIVYRRTRGDAARVEELEHASEGIELEVLRSRSSSQRRRDRLRDQHHLEVMGLGSRTPYAGVQSLRDAPRNCRRIWCGSGRTASPIIKIRTEAVGLAVRPIIQTTDSSKKPRVRVSGGDAARGGSTAIRAASV